MLTIKAIAGTCYLQDLPVHLLYRATQLLDLHSQHNLFLCSPQLYSKWYLQFVNADSLWQFIRSCIDLIAATLSAGVCNSGSLCFVSEEFHYNVPEDIPLDSMFDAAFKFRPSGKPSTMMVTHWKVSPLKWAEMTKDQLWHYLLGLPRLMNALSGVSSANGVGYDILNALGQQLFTLLCSSNGSLQFVVRPKDGVSQDKGHLPELQVEHHVMSFATNGPELLHAWMVTSAVWTLPT